MKITTIALTMVLAGNLHARKKKFNFKSNTAVLNAIKRDLVKSNGRKAKVTEEMRKKRFTLVYFSAHWCSPCRAFTPQLVDWYNQDHKDFNVILVSSDTTQDAMTKYMEETKMPWLGIKKGSDSEQLMSKKFRISSGIPSLVLIENGQVVKLKTQSPVLVFKEMNKLLGKKNAYKKEKKVVFKTNVDVLKAIKDDLIAASGKSAKVTKAMVRKRFLLVYFSAHWCPPCRVFTPKLVKWYNEDHKYFDIIFVSAGLDQKAMTKYMKDAKMPWLGIKKASDSEQLMADKFKISTGIPSLVLIDKGQVVRLKTANPAGVFNEMKSMLENEMKKKAKK